MALTTEFRRRVEKASTVAGQKPTIAPSNDHTDGTWSATDIYDRELFINLADGAVYTRQGNDIVQLNVKDGIVSGLAIVQGANALSYTLQTGTYMHMGRLYAYTSVADAIQVSAGDSTNPRIDAVYIDENATPTVVAGTPSANPTVPSLPSADDVLLGYIVVNVNQTSLSTGVDSVTIKKYDDKYHEVLPWSTETGYIQDMLVIESNTLYKCLVTHGSGTFSTDLSANKWVAIGNSSLLGTPTDTTWDGLFDHTGQTHEDALDLHNGVLNNLVPQSAPNLSDASGSKTISVNGKLSFDTANAITGYRAADDAGITNPIGVDGAFDVSGKRLGITSAVSGGNITGVLNDQVLESTQNPTPAYSADSFGKADQGVLKLEINGTLISQLDLTSSTGILDGTSSGTVSGFHVSALISSKFPQGGDFDTFKNRTGTFVVVESDLDNGYNDIVIKHEIGATIYSVDEFEVVVDDSTVATTFASESLTSPSMTGSKKLSGIDYHTGGTASYAITIGNAYRNTYYSGADAITHSGTNCTSPQQALANNGGDEALNVVLNKTATIDNNIRLINGSISLNTTCKRTVQADGTSSGVTLNNLLVDAVVGADTDLYEDFSSEEYRLPSNFAFDDFGTFALSNYDSENSINNSDAIAGYSNGLQVSNGKLTYPDSNFSTAVITNGSTFNNGGTKGGSRDYTSASGDRVYIRKFKQVSPTTSNFTVNVQGNASITFSPITDALTSSSAHIEFKAPSQTGWLDGMVNYDAVQGDADGEGGRNSSLGLGGINTDLGLTIGAKSTANSGGYILVRITVADSFLYDFDNITFSFE